MRASVAEMTVHADMRPGCEDMHPVCEDRVVARDLRHEQAALFATFADKECSVRERRRRK